MALRLNEKGFVSCCMSQPDVSAETERRCIKIKVHKSFSYKVTGDIVLLRVKFFKIGF